MGVKGLWRLLLPIGRRISIETLEGKILAIDASIWLTQFIKAMRDDSGNLRQAAHLIGFFRRICRLKYHKIKPVFVFDGATPEIKRREVLQRKRRREQFAKVSDETVQRMAKKLLAENLRNQATLQATPEGAFVAGFTNPTDDDDDRKPPASHKADGTIDDDAKPEEKVSDWDVPLAVAAATEAEEQEDAEEEEEQTQYEDFIAKEEFSIEQISSLPAVKRKDAIEHSKRQQRLQSRKEFMPAAANPDKFSSVQLKNFLKYCKLNKDIVKMAKVAADKDNAGLSGDAMASDRATRIELIREDDSNENSGPVRSLLAERTNAKRAKRKDNDHSSDECWGNGITASAAAGRCFLDDDEAASIEESAKPSRRMIVLDENLSDDEEEDGGGRLVASSKQRSKPSDALELLDDSSTGSGSGGGFVVASNTTKEPIPRKTDNIDLLHDSDSEDGGGFIAAQHADDHVGASARHGSDHATGAEHNGDAKQASSDIREASATTDATLAQELADSALARALQMEEDQYSSHQNRDDTSRTVGQDTRSSAQPCESLAQSKTTRSEVSVIPAKPAATKDDVVSKIKPDDAPIIQDSSEEDSVEWEDGDDQELPIARAEAEAAVSVETEKSRTSDALNGNMAESFDAFDGQANGSHSFSDDASTGESVATKAKPQTDGDGVSEALLSAQATASNLANWAGRAFRRALKEVGSTDKAIGELPREVTEPPMLNQDAKSSSTVVPAISTPVAASSPLHNPVDQANERRRPPARKETPIGNHRQQSSASRAARREDNPGDFEFPFDLNLLDGHSGINEPTEAHRRERDMETISDEMLLEAKQLLQLFGVPYVEAPAEAEAQCAALERLGLVDGIVTEDSDVFVFGGKTGKPVDSRRMNLGDLAHPASVRSVQEYIRRAEVR